MGSMVLCLTLGRSYCYVRAAFVSARLPSSSLLPRELGRANSATVLGLAGVLARRSKRFLETSLHELVSRDVWHGPSVCRKGVTMVAAGRTVLFLQVWTSTVHMMTSDSVPHCCTARGIVDRRSSHADGPSAVCERSHPAIL